MNLEEQSRLSYFRRIADVGTHENISFVQHVETMQVFVKKELEVFDKEIYLHLMSHPNRYFPRIFECVEDAGMLTVIEEYIPGATLETYLQKRGTFSLSETAGMMCQICAAVGELHRLDPPFIHRDLTPSNIMIEKDGGIKIVDLNTARKYEQNQGRDTVIIGTRHYAAPEQYGFRQSDARTDIYALGVLMNYLLTGKYPEEEICPGEAGQIVRRCICFEPSGRYRSVEELAKAISNFDEKGLQNKKCFLWLPPGFRTVRPWKMILAGIGYVFVFWLALSNRWVSEEAPVGEQRLNCIGVLALFLILIFFWFDYGNMHRHIPLMRQKRWKPLGMILYSILIFFFVPFVVVLMEGLCF